MTGFARVRQNAPEGELVVSIKSVNHRGLDIHFHMPPDFDGYEPAVRAAIKARVARGHLQVRVALETSDASGAATLNRTLLAAWLSAFRQGAEEFQIRSTPDLNSALRIPGMFQGCLAAEPNPGLEKSLLAATEEALAALNGFREQEGQAIAAEICHRCSTICELITKMETVRFKATGAFQTRLKERLEELLGVVGLEPQRLAQEAALLAERSDISEELVRLKIHAAQVGEMISASGEIGKRLDFLMQEMNRETNTILAKSGGLGELGLAITDLALAAKGEIDKIREQSLNLE